ncbi:hypothetical protein GOV05_03020 [Candidatus Woesearchaeota archaeon]|nr:hypothetical protein [Candidatus Woesearchaeota archaeon]
MAKEVKAKVVKKDWHGCFGGKGFPTFAVIILVIGLWMLLQEIGVISSRISVWPMILVVAGIGWIIEYYTKKN